MNIIKKNEETCPTIFLDRDGVLNVEKSYICSIDELEIYDYARKSVDMIHQKGYLAIVISNQSGIARGLFSEESLQKMNAFLMDNTGVDAVYYCPHYLQGKVKKYAIDCDCRKPNIGLLQKSGEDYSIDMKQSYMVGDRAVDILTGQNAGVKTVLLKTGYGERGLEFDITPDHIYDNLLEFAKKLPRAKRGGRKR